MNLDIYLKKVYTVAFRLTGDENKALSLAQNAIDMNVSNMCDKVDSTTFAVSAMEVCRLFLEEMHHSVYSGFELGENMSSFQDALMCLNPLGRTAVVWRDVLGRSLDEISAMGYNKNELYYELNRGRRSIKSMVKDC